jgi:hypothetical protein
MPCYQYQDPETRQIVERILPVDQRDTFPHRLQVPLRIFARRNIPSPNGLTAGVPAALKNLEEKHGAEAVARESGFSVRALQRIWGEELKAAR